MAIRGSSGTLTFSREWSGPLVLPVSALSGSPTVRLAVEDLAFWAGDQVSLFSAAGLPFDIAGTGFANTPDGHAFWGGGGSQGPATQHRTGDAGTFWAASDDAVFWESAGTVGLTTSATFYIHRDQLDRLSFYSSELAGLNGGAAGRVQAFPEISTPLLLAVASTASGYNGALLDAASDPAVLAVDEELQPSSILALPPIIEAAGAEADQRGWKRQADLEQYVFETDPGLLDQSAIGEEFGDSTKGLVRGAGSYRAILSNRYLGPGVSNGIAFLRLILLTRSGSKCSARFMLTDGEDAGICQGAGVIDGPVFYETDILLGRGTLDTSATDLASLAGAFVCVGAIRLVSGDP